MSEQKRYFNYTDEQIKTIKASFLTDVKSGKVAPDDFVKTFIHTCESTGLDPFRRMIMASMRNVNVGKRDAPVWKQVWSTVVTIDGFRSIAEGHGDYEGQEGPYWCGKDGVWKDVWVGDISQIVAAKVVIFRKGFRAGINGIARLDAYKQDNEIWRKLGDHMSAKCAEALGLRKAFPQELGGLYTTDEMAQAGLDTDAIREETLREAQAAGRDISGVTPVEPKPEPKAAAKAAPKAAKETPDPTAAQKSYKHYTEANGYDEVRDRSSALIRELALLSMVGGSVPSDERNDKATERANEFAKTADSFLKDSGGDLQAAMDFIDGKLEEIITVIEGKGLKIKPDAKPEQKPVDQPYPMQDKLTRINKLVEGAAKITDDASLNASLKEFRDTLFMAHAQVVGFLLNNARTKMDGTKALEFYNAKQAAFVGEIKAEMPNATKAEMYRELLSRMNRFIQIDIASYKGGI